MTEILGEFGKGLAGQWVARSLAPAAVFWVGGLAALAHDWETLTSAWPKDVPEQVALLAVGLLVLGASAALMEVMAPTLIRWLEGYWPWPFEGLRYRLARNVVAQATTARMRWDELDAKGGDQKVGALTDEERDEKTRLDLERSSLPADLRRALPTSLGNLLRSAEDYSKARYGLDAIVCWPRVWLLLPQETRQELGSARSSMDQAVEYLAWGVLYLVFGAWSWWAIPAGLIVAWVSWRLLQLRAKVFGDLLRAVFDIHRFSLYKALHLPLPTNASVEGATGANLTEYLFRGNPALDIKFVAPEKDPKD